MALRCAPLSAVARHLFTAADLRLLDHDEREWRDVAARMDVAFEGLRLIRQVHGADVAIVRSGDGGTWQRPQADVIVSDDPTVAVGVRVADCVPVLIGDSRQGVVGAAHSGWRGTVKRAAAAAVRAMTDAFGSDPRDLVAAIGPCLGPCCGEVGTEVVDAFREAGHADADLDRWFTTDASGRPFLNLWEANRDQLHAAGIPRRQIHAADICTKTYSARFHSYRAAGTSAGRMVGVIRARD